MSSIGSEYSALRRSGDELEKEYETQRKQAKEREAAREAKLLRNSENTARAKDRQLESAVGAVKENYQSLLADEAKLSRGERERLQKEVYDRSGRRANAIAEVALTDRDRAIETANAAEKHYDKAIADSEKYYENRSREISETNAREREELVDSYRKQLAEARGGSKEERAGSAEYREKVKREAQEAVRRAQADLTQERKFAQKNTQDLERKLHEQNKKSDNYVQSRLQEKNELTQAQLEKRAVTERQSRANELGPMREQLLATSDLRKEAQTAKANAQGDVYREYENEWKAVMKNQERTHELEKQKIRNDAADLERLYSERRAAYVHDKDTQAADTVSRAYKEHHAEIQRLIVAYEQTLDQADEHLKEQEAYATKKSEQKQTTADEKREKALAKQAAAFQEALSNQKANLQAQMNTLQRRLQHMSTTADAGAVSPQAEEAIRNTVSTHYEKKFTAESNRNADAREYLANAYQKKVMEEKDKAQSRVGQISRQSSTEQTQMRNQFVHHLTDVEDNKQRQLNHAAESGMRMSDNLTKNHERALNDYRRHYETLVAEREQDTSNRIHELISKHDFERQATRREHMNATMDLTRGFEKKLSDQKNHYEEVLRDMKAKLDTGARENDRRLKQALAEQARSYEHRLAETNAQMQTRERTLARNHEDELDKVRQANALLLSKKG